jgi:hypothetical protein
MKISKLMVLAVVVAVMAGFTLDCRTVLAADTAASADWKFHAIVDIEFVQQHVSVPMPEGVMLIELR